jgi:hypothetical protein
MVSWMDALIGTEGVRPYMHGDRLVAANCCEIWIRSGPDHLAMREHAACACNRHGYAYIWRFFETASVAAQSAQSGGGGMPTDAFVAIAEVNAHGIRFPAQAKGHHVLNLAAGC